jgi:predicted tellurium resistance membrane protein TerC
MIELFSNPATWTALVSLTAMEVVLGIDNLVFISVLTGKLPKEQRRSVTRTGVGAALVLRVGMLFGISWIMHLTTVLFSLGAHGVTWKHLILLAGGLFLMWKATTEIYEKVEHREDHAEAKAGEDAAKKSARSAAGAIAQIIGIDLVFSIDSIATAVGMVDEVPVMVVAMLVAVTSMMAFAGSIGAFVEKHPSMKILALSFLLLIGALLVAEALGQHISKGYIYFAMGFSVLVELLNMRFRQKAAPANSSATTPAQPG